MDRLAKPLIWLFVFAVPWENVLILQGVGTSAKLLGLVAGGVGMIGVLAKARVRQHLFLWAGLLFVVWAWASLLWSLEQESTFQRALTYTQLWIMAFLEYSIGKGSF